MLIKRLYSFNLPKFTNGTFPIHAPLRSQSSESIDTRFSPDGSRPNFFSPPPNRTSTPLRNVSPAHATPQQGFDENGQSTQDSHSTRTVPPPPPPPAQGKWDQAQWSSHLEGVKFDMDNPPTGRSASRTSTRKRVRTWPKPPNVQPTVNDATDEPTASSTTGESVDSSNVNSDVDPMDLDEPTPPHAKAGGTKLDANPGPSSQVHGTTGTPRQGPSLPPREKTDGEKEPSTAKFNLGDWQHNYPFAPSNEGLANMNDLTTSLPFESRASPKKPPVGKPTVRHGLPMPPLCVDAPPNLTFDSCKHYLKKLHQYMEAWNEFNTRMVTILSEKQAFNRKCSQCNWLDIKGNGYERYMKGLDEHRRARLHIETAYERHEKNMEILGLVRAEIIRGRGGAGRRPSDVGDMLENLL